MYQTFVFSDDDQLIYEDLNDLLFNIIRKDSKEYSAFICFELVSHMKKGLLINYILGILMKKNI